VKDPFGLDDDMKIIIFKCLDCGQKDKASVYVVDEFHYDLKVNEEIEVVLQRNNATNKKKTQVSKLHLGWDLSRVSDFVLILILTAFLIEFEFFAFHPGRQYHSKYY
jgi:hypothetical protein